jgi:hypothetical protein
MPKIVL